MLATVLYAITLGGGYIYDDKTIVRDDPRMHDPGKWGQLWNQAYFPAGVDHLYRPLVSSSYAIEWWLHGDRPWIFHAGNILLHALTAAAVAELTRRVILLQSLQKPDASLRVSHCSALGIEDSRKANRPALIAGLLFAAHPIHVDAVANIVGRAELGCSACIFTALILLCGRRPTVACAVGIVIVGFSGLLCKEQGIVQPLLWIFLCFAMFKPTSHRLHPVFCIPHSAFIKTLLLLTTWSWAIYLLLREHYLKFEWSRSDMDSTFNPLIQSVGWDRVLMPVVLVGHYIALLLWPAHLSLDYGADVFGHVAKASDPYLWIGLLAIASGCAGVIASRGNNTDPKRFFRFCLLSLAISYGVVSNTVTLIGTNFAERLMYLPSAFFLMIVAVLLCKLPPRGCAGVTTLILIGFSIRTVTAAGNWNHPVALYEASLTAQPKSIQAHLLLAEEYQHQRNFPAARLVLQEACEQYRNYWRVWQYCSEESLAEGNLTLADQYLAHAIHLDHQPALLDLADRIAKARAAEAGK